MDANPQASLTINVSMCFKRHIVCAHEFFLHIISLVCGN